VNGGSNWKGCGKSVGYFFTILPNARLIGNRIFICYGPVRNPKKDEMTRELIMNKLQMPY
jgi:hypothetical protein